MMKLAFMFAFAGTLMLSSCSKDEDDDTVDPVEPTPETTITVEGDITTNTSWAADKQVILKGKVYVQDGVTLTIAPGTIVKGDKATTGALIINRGGKLVAEGTATQPIVFTSSAPAGFRNRGDWGGVIICGRGKQNSSITAAPYDVTIEGISAATGENGKYGAGNATLNDANNAASMKFCRIEFAGVPLSDDNELNSLTLGAVGSGSTFENIMITYANDDAIEPFGGSANFKYVVIFSTNDDDLDTDQGYTGSMQFVLVMRDEDVADKSGARCWESSSNSSGNDPDSKPLFSNVTVLGPLTYARNSASGNVSGNYRAAVEINSNSNIEIHNSLILGYADAINLSTAGATASIKNCVFGFDPGAADLSLTVAGASNKVDSLENIYGAAFTNNRLVANGSTMPNGGVATDNRSLKTSTVIGYTNPAPLLDAASPYRQSSPDVTSVSSFFADVDYIGAFGTSADAGWSWTSGWLNWDPINAAY